MLVQNKKVIIRSTIAFPMDTWVLLGMVAGMLTTVGFIPQIVRGYRTKKMDDVSLFMPILLSAGMGLWLGYGLVLNDLPIVFWNAVALTFNLVIVALKLKYKRIRASPAKNWETCGRSTRHNQCTDPPLLSQRKRTIGYA
jgi:MtN3 and saliva related transmembrane protein